MRIAILGAGFLGVCLALELSQRGIAVELIDKNTECITQAGFVNQGKIHLGFQFAADLTFKTAEIMMKRALEFTPLLKRWVGSEFDAIPLSSPFIYALEKNSLLTRDQIRHHFMKLDDLLSISDPLYIGDEVCCVQELTQDVLEEHFNPENIQAAFKTPERSINVMALAKILREHVTSNPNILFLNETLIDSVVIRDQIDVHMVQGKTQLKESYDLVVNGLWDGRLKIDHQLGFTEETPCYRLKHGIYLSTKNVSCPSTTIIQGPFGDVVNFENKDLLYMSWYPSCLKGVSYQFETPNWSLQLSPDDVLEMISTSYDHFSRYIHGVKNIWPDQVEEYSINGGIIFAHGISDIDDPKSGLHQRASIGIQSRGNYYSVNPGKYSLCPSFAFELAEKMAPCLIS